MVRGGDVRQTHVRVALAVVAVGDEQRPVAARTLTNQKSAARRGKSRVRGESEDGEENDDREERRERSERRSASRARDERTIRRHPLPLSVSVSVRVGCVCANVSD